MIGRRQMTALVGGAAAAWPLAAQAQQKAMPVVGRIGHARSIPNDPTRAAFLQGLAEAGYVEGRNVLVEQHMTESRSDRLRALVADLTQI